MTIMLVKAEPLLLVSGLVLIAGSLISPAVQHGKVLTGIEAMVISTLLSVVGRTGEGSGGSLVTMCRLAFVSHACVLLDKASRLFPKHGIWTVYSFGVVGTICVLNLFALPYDGFEHVFAGYYFWLTGLLLVVLSNVVWALEQDQNRTSPDTN